MDHVTPHASETEWPILILVEETTGRVSPAIPLSLTPFGLFRWSELGRAWTVHLASLLPASAADLTHHWIRLRSWPFYRRSPLLTLFTIDDLGAVANLVKAGGQTVILVASSRAIRTLVRQKFPRSSRLLILHDQSDVLQIAPDAPNVRFVKFDQADPVSSVVDIYHALLGLFQLTGLRTGSGDEVSSLYRNGYAVAKSFLPPYDVSGELETLANGIVASQIRGCPPHFVENRHSSDRVVSTDAIDTETATRNDEMESLESLYRLLAERELDVWIERVTQGRSLDASVPTGIVERVACMAQDRASDSGVLLKLYHETLDAIVEWDCHTNALKCEELLVLAPNLNLRTLSSLWQTTAADERYVIERLMEGGRRLQLSQKELDTYGIEPFMRLTRIRGMDSYLLYSLAGMAGAFKLSPILKCPHVGADLVELCQRISGQIAESSGDDRMRGKLMRYLTSLFRHMTTAVGSKRLAFLANKARRITFMSNLPLELAWIDKLPLGAALPWSRVPLTPGCNLTRIVTSGIQDHDVSLASFQNPLITVTLASGDPIIRDVRRMSRTVEEMDLDLRFQFTNTPRSFFAAFKRTTPSVWIHIGHGCYDERADSVRLLVGNKWISLDSIHKELESVPPIIVLLSCETASSAPFAGNLISQLLHMDARVVVAPLFPIRVDTALAFLVELYVTTREIFSDQSRVSLAELIWRIRLAGLIRYYEHAKESGLATDIVTDALKQAVNAINGANDVLGDRSIGFDEGTFERSFPLGVPDLLFMGCFGFATNIHISSLPSAREGVLPLRYPWIWEEDAAKDEQ